MPWGLWGTLESEVQEWEKREGPGQAVRAVQSRCPIYIAQLSVAAGHGPGLADAIHIRGLTLAGAGLGHCGVPLEGVHCGVREESAFRAGYCLQALVPAGTTSCRPHSGATHPGFHPSWPSALLFLFPPTGVVRVSTMCRLAFWHSAPDLMGQFPP